MTANLTLSINHEVFAPREIIFDVWTAAEHLAYWYSLGDDCTRQASVQLEPGGAYTLAWTTHEQTFTQCGEFIEVTPPARLAYTMRFGGAYDLTNETRVTVDFIDGGGKTRLDLQQAGLPDEAARERLGRDWLALFAQLENYLSAI